MNDRSKYQYGRVLTKFFLWCSVNNVDPDNVRKSDIINYKQQLVKKGKSARTINLYISVLRQFYAWMENNGNGKNIVSGIKNERVIYDYAARSLTIEQARKLLKVINRSTLIGLRDYCMINIMLHEGLRRVEVSRINIEDITQEDGKIVLRLQGKGKIFKDDIIPLQQAVYEPIRLYIQKLKRKKGPLFTSMSSNNKGQRITTFTIGEIVKKYLRKIGLYHHTAHSLRHTTAILLLENGMDIYEVMNKMRHAKIETTVLYLKSIKRKRIMEDRPGKLLERLLTS